MIVVGLAVVVLVFHPVWWWAGGRRALGRGWWSMSGVAWGVVAWWLWGVGEFWLGWATAAVATLCVTAANGRCDRITSWMRVR